MRIDDSLIAKTCISKMWAEEGRVEIAGADHKNILVSIEKSIEKFGVCDADAKLNYIFQEDTYQDTQNKIIVQTSRA